MKMVSKRKLVVVLKGYPRLSETFIAQELLSLEQAGFDLLIVSLRLPTDTTRHPVHNEIQADVLYLPEYLHQSPLRVLRGLLASIKKPGFSNARKHFFADLRRDLTRNRIRRFGQAMVLAAEWPEGGQYLYAHFIHTPASVAAYTSDMMGIPWSVSAHAKDIWTSPDWELEGKLGAAQWSVTCTAVGHQHLQGLAPDATRIHLNYHGLDLSRFPPLDGACSGRNGKRQDDPVIILSVGRAVKKKGYDVLLQALAELPPALHWQFVHIGGGKELASLQQQAEKLRIEKHITWLGALDQREVLQQYRAADLFVLASRITDDGDRDGLPNVLVEAASQGLACIASRISAIPELLVDDHTGLLVEANDAAALSKALTRAIEQPALRLKLGTAAQAQVRSTLDHHASIDTLVELFDNSWK